MRAVASLAFGLLAVVSLPAFGQEKLVKVGIARGLATTGNMIAIEKGYFKAAGIRVEIEELDTTSNVMSVLAQGQLQIVEGGISVAYFNGLERKLPITIVGDRVSSPLGHKLLIRADLADKIRTPADLRGRTIASNGAGAVTTYELHQILRSGGVGVKDTDIKVLNFVNMGVALANKAIDAALVIQPWASQYVEQGIAKVFADPDDFADPRPMTIAANFINTDWMNANRSLVYDYFVAYQRGAREYCQAYHGGRNRPEVIDIITRTGMETRRDVLDRYPWPARNSDGRINIASLLDMQKYYLAEGLATQEIPVERLVDNEFVDAATKKLGPFEVENRASALAGCR